jgi:hypothetical protein
MLIKNTDITAVELGQGVSSKILRRPISFDRTEH